MILPTIWNVPYTRDKYFIGRDDLLVKLKTSLKLVNKKYIIGPDGIGKTQLIVEYAYRHRFDYNLIWWVRACDFSTFVSDYLELAYKLKLPESNATDFRILIGAVNNWLEGYYNWLLIFDDVPNLNEISKYLPKSYYGHIIITSSSKEFFDHQEVLKISDLQRGYAVQLLRNRSLPRKQIANIEISDRTAKYISWLDETEIYELAGLLGDFPLALNQAGTYISVTNIKMPKYLSLFKNYQEIFWKEQDSKIDYLKIIFCSLYLAIDQVKEEDIEAFNLLKLCSFFSSRSIDPIYISSMEDGGYRSAKRLNKLIKILNRYALVEIKGNEITIPKLYKDIIRSTLTEEERELILCKLVKIINKNFDLSDMDMNKSKHLSNILSHAITIFQYAEALRVNPEKTASLYANINRGLKKYGLSINSLELKDYNNSMKPTFDLDFSAKRLNDLEKSVVSYNKRDTVSKRTNIDIALLGTLPFSLILILSYLMYCIKEMNNCIILLFFGIIGNFIVKMFSISDERLGIYLIEYPIRYVIDIIKKGYSKLEIIFYSSILAIPVYNTAESIRSHHFPDSIYAPLTLLIILSICRYLYIESEGYVDLFFRTSKLLVYSILIVGYFTSDILFYYSINSILVIETCSILYKGIDKSNWILVIWKISRIATIVVITTLIFGFIENSLRAM